MGERPARQLATLHFQLKNVDQWYHSADYRPFHRYLEVLFLSANARHGREERRDRYSNNFKILDLQMTAKPLARLTMRLACAALVKTPDLSNIETN